MKPGTSRAGAVGTVFAGSSTRLYRTNCVRVARQNRARARARNRNRTSNVFRSIELDYEHRLAEHEHEKPDFKSPWLAIAS